MLTAGMTLLASCSGLDYIWVQDPIKISSPTPTEQITKVTLDETQTGYVEAGNRMAFRFLDAMFEGDNLICSPLSLQYALAMTANGATGQTQQQIIDFLGYGSEGIDILNEYSRTLLEQLPAVDMDVKLKVTDALIVNKDFPLLPEFKQTVEDHYYAAVENMDFSNPGKIAARINKWAKQNTNGFLDKILEADEIDEDAVAYLMNALYFKAKWAGDKYCPMFREEGTKSENFNLKDGKTVKAEMMRNTRDHEYAEMDGYKVLVLPYANGKFNMYVLLPDENDIEGMIEKLQTTSWSDILANLKKDAEVHVRLPKFNIEKKYTLNDVLQSLGVRKPFERGFAEFDRMFEEKDGYYYWINKVIQKSRIGVSEWGTEAGSVTIVDVVGETGPAPEPKQIYFYADHPFAFVIGEETSGTILFEGVVMQP